MSEIALILAIFTVNYWIYEHYSAKHKKNRASQRVENELPIFYPPKPSMTAPLSSRPVTPRKQYTQDGHFLKVSPPPVSARFRKRVMSYQCMDCDWGVRDIEQSLIIKQCPSCHASIMTGERKAKR